MSTAKVRRVKPYNGFTESTSDRLLLDAGVFFKNFIVGTDTYASAKADGKCLGVTIKGGEVSIKPNLRRLEFDGVKTRTIGDTVIDGYESYIKATLAEMTEDNLVMAIGSADVAEATDVTGYNIIQGRDTILPTDYVRNITWVGCLLGETEPCIIQIFNGYNENGLTIGVADKDNGKIEVQFYGYLSAASYASDAAIAPPFKIYRPTSTATTQEV